MLLMVIDGIFLMNDDDCLSWDITISLTCIKWRMDLDIGSALFFQRGQANMVL